jgi:F-type H+-transporting ATPase subunit epsilon
MLMQLKVLLPYGVFADHAAVERIVVQTREGSHGLLPRRRDCMALLVPGILLYQCAGQPEACAAVDEGLMVKMGEQVVLSVRNAVAGTDLAQLRAALANDFGRRERDERDMREVLARIETRFISQVADLRRG